jgi:putative hydrolase of the HAD superfamily
MKAAEAGKIVFFDVDGVLLHPGNAHGRSSQPWHATLERDLGVEPRRLSEAFFAPVGPGAISLMEACSTGMAVIEEALPPVLAKLGYRGDIETFLRYWFEHDAHVDHALIEEVAALRDRHGCRCYLATSQEHRRAAFIWNELGMRDHFSGMYYTARLGRSKKTADFYRAIAVDFDFASGVPIYFDDREEMVRTAASADWDACLYESIDSLRRHPAIAALRGAAA